MAGRVLLRGNARTGDGEPRQKDVLPVLGLERLDRAEGHLSKDTGNRKDDTETLRVEEGLEFRDFRRVVLATDREERGEGRPAFSRGAEHFLIRQSRS